MTRIADIRTLPKTRLVTTGTLVGIENPTAEEVRDFLAEGGEVHDGCVMLTRERAKCLAWKHTVVCAGFCPVCVLRAEGHVL